MEPSSQSKAGYRESFWDGPPAGGCGGAAAERLRQWPRHFPAPRWRYSHAYR